MTRRFAVLGYPVAHSRSPALHRHWFERHGIDATYEAIPVDPGRAPELRAILDASGLDGANLTVPFKGAALDAIDGATELARAAGSVNTVWREGDRWLGDSTDAPGFVAALRASGPLPVAAHPASDAGIRSAGPFGSLDPQRPAVVLGAGGAGRAVAAGLAAEGWGRIALLNRTPERARAAVDALSAAFPDTAFTGGPLRDLEPEVGLVAMCVSGPGRDAIRALRIDSLPADARWCDLNYWDPDPPHRDALGARFDDGSAMLVHQAALAFARWTGIPPDPTDVRIEPEQGTGARLPVRRSRHG